MPLLQDVIPKPTAPFDALFEQEIDLYSKRIRCSELYPPDYETKKITDPQVLDIIDGLNEREGPCLYWFEADSPGIARELLDAMEKSRRFFAQPDQAIRVFPATNRNAVLAPESQVLYVGKRNYGFGKRKNLSHASGRMAIHFGHYHVGTTQGLHLAHWAKYDLTLHVMFLPTEATVYLPLLEKELAKKLKPLCGRH
ncbi:MULTISPECIES: hypothetical protein [unclassified Flavobacterium]|uniref:hypothetical protein n=1 Tax=unclassified Flavobacterium TaxID=196869 RepID=UPI001F12A3DE|nr:MULTISPECIES: hypothetical protein [unclassified Flavobacterium]UMY66879.1 hypothetical protein MKO97_05715 [Flavobacterium sp. HJ-32-4]